MKCTAGLFAWKKLSPVGGDTDQFFVGRGRLDKTDGNEIVAEILSADDCVWGDATLLANAPWYRVLALIAVGHPEGKSLNIRPVKGWPDLRRGWVVHVGNQVWSWQGGADALGVPLAPPEAMFLEIKQAVEGLGK
jgi:hypothetical protein